MTKPTRASSTTNKRGRARVAPAGREVPAGERQKRDGDGGVDGEGAGDDAVEASADEADFEREALDAAQSSDAGSNAGDDPTTAEADGSRELAPLSSSRFSSGASAGPDRTRSAVRDPVGRLMAEVRSYPRLSETEERELGRAVRESGDREAARRLVVHNLRLVVAIAHQYRRAWANILDLFQEGSVGLMEAVKRWEPTLGPRFGSYAAYWIRAYVLKFLMTNSRLVHVGNTRAGRKLFFRLERERQKLIASGFEPTPKLLAAKLDVDEKDLNEVGRHLDSREISFDPQGARGEEDEGYALSERIPIAQASPEQSAATAEMSGALRQVMGDFFSALTDERERAVWQDHLASAEPLPLGEIGARFGVSKQRMGQIADSLKRRFRDQIVARMGPDIRTDWLGGEE
jgi:RNA polymerase sigma-32 factor